AFGDTADQVLDRIKENWRWSDYWFGKTGIDDVYVAGKRVSALIFWNKNEYQPIRGLCSSDLGLCLAYIGPYQGPVPRRMQISADIHLQSAFTLFAGSGFHDPSQLLAVEGITPADFQYEEKS